MVSDPRRKLTLLLCQYMSKMSQSSSSFVSENTYGREGKHNSFKKENQWFRHGKPMALNLIVHHVGGHGFSCL